MTSVKAKQTSYSKTVKSNPSYNILIAGESGTGLFNISMNAIRIFIFIFIFIGKTAVVNMIFDNIQLKISSSAMGCTDKCASVRGPLNDYPDLNLRVIDTVGLCESVEGTVPSEQAMQMLEKELEDLHNNKGIHLILFCIKKGRQSNATSQHYQIIVHDLCEREVPCLLVITRCEDDDPLGEWWIENEVYIRQQLKYDVQDAVAVTTIKNDEFLEEYKESRRRLIQGILKYSLKQPWRTTNFKEKFSTFMKKHFTHKSVQSKKSDDYMNYLQRPMNESSTPKKSSWFWPFSK